MNEYRRKEIQEKLLQPTLTRDELKSVLIDLREGARSNSKLREIGDFIAHNDGRDRGLVVDHGSAIAASVHQQITQRSGTVVISPVFKQSEFIAELCLELKRQGFKFDESKIISQSATLFLDVLTMLQGVKIILNLEGIQSGKMGEVENRNGISVLKFCFPIPFQGKNVSICFDAFRTE